MGQLGDLSPEGSVAVGIVVGLLSTSIQSLGLTLQRKSHLIEDAKEEVETRRPPYKRRKWQIGMSMFIISNIVGSTIQITTLPLPVLSTLQASGLVFNTAFATLLLKEPFTRFSLVGTILTCAGAALIAIFGAIGEPAHNLAQLLDLLSRRNFIVWMVGTLLVAVITILVAHIMKVWSSHKHIEKTMLKTERPRSSSIIETSSAALKRSFTASLPQPLQIRISRLRLVRGLCYALISGILSAHSLLVAKSAVELLVRTVLDHNNQFNRFQSWLILLALLFFALTQLYYLHLGLRLCSTSVLYPFVFCVYNIIAILDGLIYFRQASRLSALHGGLIALGTVILLSGVLALSWRLDDTPPIDPAPQAVPPQTPLTPGMGLMRSSEDMEREPLLPTGRRGSSASASRQSSRPNSPIIYKRKRAPTLTVNPPTPESGATDIWAELDDEDNDEDILGSLPRTTSPLMSQNLHHPRTRRRGDSASSQAISTSSRRSSSGNKSNRKPSPLSKTTFRDDTRRSSAPQERMRQDGGTEAPETTSTRNRSATVRFSDHIPHDAPRPSRWDLGVSQSQAGDRKRNDENAKNGHDGKGHPDDPGG